MTVSKIWVFAEATDGKASTTTLEMLAKAGELADTVECVTAAGADVAAELGAHGASKVLHRRRNRREAARSRPCRPRSPLRSKGGNAPDAILIATSYDGRDVAGRLSVKLDAPVITQRGRHGRA